MNDFYSNFIKICNMRGVAPTTVAKNIGISTPNVTYWKNGSDPKMSTVSNIADHLKVPPAALLSADYLNWLIRYVPEIETALENGEDISALISDDEERQYSVAVKHYSERIKKLLSIMSEDGMVKAVDRVEELSKIPDYQKDKPTP